MVAADGEDFAWGGTDAADEGTVDLVSRMTCGVDWMAVVDDGKSVICRRRWPFWEDGRRYGG